MFALSGLVPWTYFANATAGATESLVSSANVVSEVHSPRLVIPVGAVLVAPRHRHLINNPRCRDAGL